MIDVTSMFATQFAEHAAVAGATAERLRGEFRRLFEVCHAALAAGGKLLFFGNGGSAADSQHLATELTGRYLRDRPAIAALALTTDSSSLTALGNDYGFDQVFSRQIEALGRPGDVAIGISTSGKSANVTRALLAARAGGLAATALTGRDGGALVGLADPLLIVPSDSTPRIQEMHITLGHLLCDALEQSLYPKGR
ncbi:MAG TPA: D-sedoheptulose 7-phosphate isomerase [Candidatus Sulfotelmatobacter sp.]|nr:D-sedoheptulose 7-phosphate isomerase [Candidatus Sulfotelmatobacter sp.]